MAWRIVLVTLTRAFSAGEPDRRGLPPEPRRSLELRDQRLALGGPLSLPLAIAAERRRVELVIQLGEALPILPERLPIEHRAGVGGGERLVARCSDERERGHGLVGPREQLAEMPEALQVGHVDVGAVVLDVPGAALGPKRRSVRRLGLRQLPEELVDLTSDVDLARSPRRTGSRRGGAAMPSRCRPASPRPWPPRGATTAIDPCT